MPISDDEAKITLERLRYMPNTIRISIGGYGTFTRDQLINEVNNRSEIGATIIETQMSYVRSFKPKV